MLQSVPRWGLALLIMFSSQHGCDTSKKPTTEVQETESIANDVVRPAMQDARKAESISKHGSSKHESSKHGSPNHGSPKHAVQFVDFTEQSKIDFVHHYDGKGEMYLAEPVASGLASLDFDADGWIDLYFLNGATIPAVDSETKCDALYRNTGGMQFEDVTDASRVCELRHSVGVAVGDYDADGFPDIFVNNFGRNTLYRNNGDGTFTDATDLAGVSGDNEMGAGACFLDVNGDSLLDLYVGNYVKQPVEANIKRTTDGFPSYPGPLDFHPEYDFLFRNEGDGSFSDQSQSSGIADIATTSMGVIAGDFNDDGDTDIIVVNDVERNVFYDNNGAGEFVEIGIQSGIAFSLDAQRNGNMGIDAGDFDNDGDLDLFTTTFSHDLPVMYRNDGSGNFMDVTQACGAGKGMFAHSNWGTAFLDVDNDGDKDLMIANGHTDPYVNKWAYTTSWKVTNALMLNTNGRFSNITESCGSGFSPVESSRGVVVDDLDNDGDVDIVVLNALTKPTVIRNESLRLGNWLQLELHGRLSCRDAIGAKVSFESGGKKFVDEIRGGRGYQSSYGQRLHFGIGSAISIDELTIRWPDGSIQRLKDVAANQILTVVQNDD